MRMKRIGLFLTSCICSAVLLTGCSFAEVKNSVSETTHKIFGKTQEVTSDQEKEKTKIEKSGMEVDDSVEKPEFESELAGSCQITMGSVFGIGCKANVSNGTVTYQWYTNNVNSNGGGTPIKGATQDSIAVDSSSPSHKFYYVVATNEVNGKINRNTSNTMEVIVWDIGTWQADENGIVRYMLIDGTYPKDTWFYVDENFCYVDPSGNRATGLVTIGNHTYFFSPEGYLQRNTTGPNGEVIDENGMVASQAAPEQPAPEQPAEEQPAPEQPAEEAPAEEAPAEE